MAGASDDGLPTESFSEVRTELTTICDVAVKRVFICEAEAKEADTPSTTEVKTANELK